MKEILEHLFNHGKLNFGEAKSIMLDITAEKYDSMQVTAFITCFNMRPITTEELDGFRAALLEKCIRVDLSDIECMDIVGTGGDGKNTYNISTLSAVVMAGAGVKVAKHGSYSASSVCGSSNVLQHLGYHFLKESDELRSQLDKHNLCFLHAPYFHPTLKSVVPVRKSLKVKSFFNMLGPLVHPAQPTHNLYGVYDNALSRVYQSILCKQNRKFAVVYNLDGFDEISLTDNFIIRSNQATQTYSPADLDMPMYLAKDLFGGQDVESNAQVFLNVLEDDATEAQKNVVIANSGYGIHLFENISLADGISKARVAIESGAALRNFKSLIN